MSSRRQRQRRHGERRHADLQQQPQANELQTVAVRQEFYAHAGPLPAPETLIRYGQALPDAPERIMRMAEEQARHRHGMERAVVNGNIAAQTRGQYIGAAIAVAALACGTFLLYAGKDIAGFAIVGAEAASLATVWVLGQVRQRKELARKAGPVPGKPPP